MEIDFVVLIAGRDAPFSVVLAGPESVFNSVREVFLFFGCLTPLEQAECISATDLLATDLLRRLS